MKYLNNITIFYFLISFSFFSYSKLPDDLSYYLQEKNKLAIPYKECRNIEEKVGQLFYINVDGFCSKSGDSIDPGYINLVKRIQPGGVLPKYLKHDFKLMRESTKKLQEASKLPLLIGLDKQEIFVASSPKKRAKIGLGANCGLLCSYLDVSPECFKKIGLLQGALQRAIGLNISLGPTIENMEGKVTIEKKRQKLDNLFFAINALGLETVIKHFPFTPKDFNLHHTNKDIPISIEEILSDYLPIFKDYKRRSNFMMSTHIYNSLVDNRNMVTFSEIWIKELLRKKVGFQGLLMTDALFMITAYDENMRNMIKNWYNMNEMSGIDEVGIFAVRSILAGNDMVILEDDSLKTEKVFKDILFLACQDDFLAKNLRHRIEESYDRILQYKKKRELFLRSQPDITEEEVIKLIDFLNDPQLCEKDLTSIKNILDKLAVKKEKIELFYTADFESLESKVSNSSFDSIDFANLTSEKIVGLLKKENSTTLIGKLKSFLKDKKKDNDYKIKELQRYGTYLLKSKEENKINTSFGLFNSLDIWPQQAVDYIFRLKDTKLINRLITSLRYRAIPITSTLNNQEVVSLQKFLEIKYNEEIAQKIEELQKTHDLNITDPYFFQKYCSLQIDKKEFLSILYPPERVNQMGIKNILNIDDFDIETRLYIATNSGQAIRKDIESGFLHVVDIDFLMLLIDRNASIDNISKTPDFVVLSSEKRKIVYSSLELQEEILFGFFTVFSNNFSYTELEKKRVYFKLKESIQKIKYKVIKLCFIGNLVKISITGDKRKEDVELLMKELEEAITLLKQQEKLDEFLYEAIFKQISSYNSDNDINSKKMKELSKELLILIQNRRDELPSLLDEEIFKDRVSILNNCIKE